MTFGLYLLLNAVLFLLLALWLRGLVVRRLRPERVLNELDGQIRSLIAELNQTGDYNISLLEDRIRELRTLVSDADRQIEEITAAIESLRYHRGAHLSAAPSAPSAPPRVAGQHLTTPQSQGDGATTPAAAEFHEQEPVYTVPFGGDTAAPSDDDHHMEEQVHGASAPEPSDEGPLASPREQVWKLHDEGLSSDLIAVRTGIAIGEVELIISLRAGKGRR